VAAVTVDGAAVPRNSFLGILWAHKVIAGVGAFVVLGLMAWTAVAVPPTYRATSSIALFNPPNPPEDRVKSGDPCCQNPLLQFNDLSVVTDILQRQLMSDAGAQSLRDAGLKGTYTVTTNADFTHGPVVILAAEGTTAAEPIASLKILQNAVSKQLLDLQQAPGRDSTYFITANIFVPASRSTKVFSATLRRLITTGGGGAVLVVALVGVAEVFSRRNRLDDPDQEAPPGDQRGLRLA
jgi:hypothetical protein